MNAIALLETYGYIILFPLAVIEGPIVTVAAGFLVRLEIFNPFFVYGIVMAGDIVGDTFLYALGRWGGKRLIDKFGSKIGITEKKVSEAKNYFSTKQLKAVAMSKLIHGIGVTGLITAGSLHVPYPKFIRTCAAISLVQVFVFLIIGLFFGHIYAVISEYFNYYAALASVIALGIIIFIVYRTFRKKEIKL